MNKNFLSNLLSQDSIEQSYLSNNVQNFSFGGCLIKTSVSVLTFTTKSAKERTIYDLLFLIAIYSPKNEMDIPVELEISTQESLYYNNPSFSRFSRFFSV